MNLELCAMWWCWIEKKCHYIIEQRAPRFWLGSPDILGVTKQRFLIEIEVKRSAADFRKDADKRHRKNRDRFIEDQAKQFYYMMPRELAEKLRPEIPEWAGLMCPDYGGQSATVLKVAPVNSKSKRLSLKECAKMCRYMTNHMMSSRSYMQRHIDNFLQGTPEPYVYPQSNGSWQI